VIERVVLVRFAPTTDVDGTVVADGTVVDADGTVDDGDGTVVDADGTVDDGDGTVVVADGTVVVADGTVVVAGEHGSVNDGTNAKPPNNTNDATTTDNRPAEVRTHRVTITPAINKNKPATTPNDELPTSGKKHTPTANTKFPIQ
jgi:uncharacterized protein with beta-barrel porin domain